MFNEFPFQAVYAKALTIGAKPVNTPEARQEQAADIVLAAHGRFSRQPTKEWTIGMLCNGGYMDVRDVARQQYRRAVNVVVDSEATEFSAVASTCEESSDLDGMLSGLSGRDLDIARAWSNGLQDIAVADLVGCSVKTVERTRKTLADRLACRV
jgi:hypothetical protein